MRLSSRGRNRRVRLIPYSVLRTRAHWGNIGKVLSQSMVDGDFKILRCYAIENT